MGWAALLASVNIIGMRVVSAAVTKGPSAALKPSTVASALACCPDFGTSSTMVNVLRVNVQRPIR